MVVIDEIAALTAYVTDRKTRTDIEHLLGLLLSQGRAVGISVVAAVQDPAKDTLPVRQLFTVRVGLRLTEATQTTMVSRPRGAGCGGRMRAYRRRHTRGRLRDDRRHCRTGAGAGLSRHRPRHHHPRAPVHSTPAQ